MAFESRQPEASAAAAACGKPAGSATDAVADVCGLRCVDDANDLQLDSRRQQLEKPAAATEQHRDLVNLQLIKHSGLERALRRVCAVHQYVPAPGGSLRLCHCAGDPIGHVGHQRIVRDRRTRWPVTGHEDPDTKSVMITAPVIDLLRSSPAN